MPDASSADVVAEIKERISIVDVISPHVALRKTGRNLVGLCPFHSERTPSFVVFPEKGNYHCFGCGASGDVFSFLMKTQGLVFGEALRALAQRAGIVLPERRSEVLVEDQKRTRLREINATAAQYFHHLLLHSEAGRVAREYLAARGVNTETIEAFQLGYSLDSWNSLLKHLVGKGYAIEDIAEAGLVVEREDGDHYDRFRNRLMFPIRDARGNITGFGARALDDSHPKYLNSPQTLLFDKSASLYGIDLASKAVRAADRVVVVEGYVDVLISHQCGIKNVVATLGTALTERQVLALKRLTKNMVLALDPDAAGDEATLRGLEVAKQVFDRKAVPVPTWRGLIRYEYKLDADIRIATLPRGRDPDEILREDANQWRALIDRALPIIDYYFNVVATQLDLTRAKDKSKAAERLLPMIAELQDKIQQAHYLQKLAHLVQVSERSLEMSLSRLKPATGVPGQKRVGGGVSAEVEGRTRISLEEYLLSLIVGYPEMLKVIVKVDVNELTDPRVRQVIASLQAWTRDAEAGASESANTSGASIDLEHFIETLDPMLGELVQSLSNWTRLQPAMSASHLEREIDNCLRELKRRSLRERIRALEHLMRDELKSEDWEGLKRRLEEHRAELALYERDGAKAWVWR